jgi:exopolysaccharide/PEP-CTERM locus tyrosine autokinase
LSLIENSLEKLRRAASAPKEGVATGAPLRLEPVATLEPRHAHKRTPVDLGRLRAEGYLPDPQEERRFADYCHRIKRPLIQRALASDAAQDARLIVLSSALPGEGKTFIAMNLALSMARERDISVLLVDGDLPKAHISRVLGLHDEPGLVNALRDDRVDVESLIFDTDIANLEVLPAGGPCEGAAELVASARMREVATRLTTLNPRRLVLFDSPPLLVSSEARALMPVPGQIVLVARAGHTPRRAITDAIANIDRKKLLGLVLNDAHVSGNQHGYYDYGYGAPAEAVVRRDRS